MQKEPVGGLARVAAGGEVDPQGPHQVAPALPVVVHERPDKLSERRQVGGAREFL